jgi:hypothetical protein
MSTTFVNIPLSDLIGADDIGGLVTEVEPVSATSPALVRGAILCKKADGTVTLAGAETTLPAAAFGILLDPAVNPTLTPTPTCTVARSGVFNATALSCDPSTTIKTLEPALRDVGIFLEQAQLT